MYRGAATGGTGGYVPPPTLKARVTSYKLVLPPHFLHNIYYDWLVPPIGGVCMYTKSLQRLYACVLCIQCRHCIHTV